MLNLYILLILFISFYYTISPVVDGVEVWDEKDSEPSPPFSLTHSTLGDEFRIHGEDAYNNYYPRCGGIDPSFYSYYDGSDNFTISSTDYFVKSWGGLINVNNYLIYAGGCSSNYDISCSTGGYIFTNETMDNPTKISNMLSVGRQDMGVASLNGLAYFAGGIVYTGENTATFYNTIDIFDTVTNQLNVSRLSVARSSIAATSIGTKVIFGCGITSFSSMQYYTNDTFDIYDTLTSTWTTYLTSSKRANYSAVTVGDYALFAGGSYFDIETATYKSSNHVDIYTYSNDTWTSHSMNYDRSCLTAVVYGSKALFAGGIVEYGSITATDTVEVFDYSTSKSWYVMATDTVEVFDSTSKSWYVIVSLSKARYALTSAIVNDVLYLYAGIIADSDSDSYSYSQTSSSTPSYALDFYYMGACDFGYYISNTSTSTCLICSSGYYSSGSTTSCSSCPAGTYTLAGRSTCVKCAINTYSLGNSSHCSTCASGSYTNTQQSTTCISCPTGYYSDESGNGCEKCNSDSRFYTSVAGSTSCLLCPSIGYEIISNFNCTKSLDAIWSKSTGETAVSAYYVGAFTNSTKAYFTRAENSIIDIFDINTQSFVQPIAESVREGATFRFYPGMATVSGYYSVIAGGLNFLTFSLSADIFYIPSLTITIINPFLTAARYKISAIAVMDVVIFAGGQLEPGNYFSNYEVYNYSSSNISSGFISTPRSEMGTASLYEFAFFAGGFNNDVDSEIILKYSNTTDIYNAKLNSWSTYVSSVRRTNISAIGVGNYALFAGGLYCQFNSCEYSNLVEKYNYLTSTWSSFNMKTSRANMAVAAAFGKAFFVGGLGYGNLYGSGTQNSIEIFDSLTDTWYLSYNIFITDSRYAIASAVIYNSTASLIFVGGLNTDGSESSNNLDVITVGCNFGYYISGSSCYTCANGQYSSGNALNCSSCPGGTYSYGNSSTCTDCSSGSFSNSSTTFCISCNPGTYSSSAASVCTNCAAGYYGLTYAATSCLYCSVGKTSLAGATNCFSCASGYSLYNTICYADYPNFWTQSYSYDAPVESGGWYSNAGVYNNVGVFVRFYSTYVDNYANGSWTMSSITAKATQYASIIFLNSRIILAGGLIPTTNYPTLAYFYFPLSNTITPSEGFLNFGRRNMAATTISDNIAIFAGGFTSDGIVLTYYSIASVYNSSVPTNSPIDNVFLSRIARSYIAATNIGNMAIFGGGSSATKSSHNYTEYTYYSSVDIYSTAVGWYSSSLSSPRTNITAVTIGNLALFVGGYYYNIKTRVLEFTKTVDVFDYTSLSWNTTTRLLDNAMMTSAVYGTRAIFVGGLNSNFIPVADIELYDSTTKIWYILSSGLSSARVAAAAATINSVILFAGGQTEITTQATTLAVDYLAFSYCNYGYYPIGTACYNCSAGNTTECISCPAGYYSNSTVVSTCLSCSIGQYSNDNSTTCFSCIPGYFSASIGSATCSPCSSGTYSAFNASSSCTNCTAGFVSNSGSSICSSCNSGTYALISGLTVCTGCSAGYYTNSTVSSCLQCPIGSYSYSNANSCQPCPTGTYSSTNATVNCSLCEFGYYSSTTGLTSCVECPVGKYANITSASSCFDCGIGSYSTVNFTSCGNCLLGHISNGTICEPCNGGYYSNFLYSSYCQNCNSGTYSLSGSSSCLNCSVGTFSSFSYSSVCTNCSVGTISSITGSTSCTSCIEGSFALATGQSFCTSCLSGYYASLNNSCLPCSLGSYSEIGAINCTLCTSGSYSATNSASSCTFCSSGYYSSSPGSTSCTKCTSGKYSNTTSSTYCYGCPFGTYSSVTSTSCNVCELGYISNGTFCEPCKVGYFSNTYYASSCKNCTFGTYSSTIASSACISCNFGTYSSTYLATFCLNCTEGTFVNITGGSICNTCISGSYAISSGLTACNSCLSGYYTASPTSACLPCNAGSFSSNSASSCTLCSSGRYSLNNSSSCLSCGYGSYSTGGTSFCINCAVGKYSTDLDNSICSNCTVGKFSSIVGSSFCYNCTLGYYSTESSSICNSCGFGYYSSSYFVSSCDICSAGSYSFSSAMTECFTCNPGSYSNSPGKSICTSCLAGSFSSSGSTGCSTCLEPYYSSILGASACKGCDFGSKWITSTSCSICEPGSYAFLNSTFNSCAECLIGTYNYLSGQTSCISCYGTYPNSTGSTTCTYPLSAKFSNSVDSILVTLASVSSYTAGSNCSILIPSSTLTSIFCNSTGACNSVASIACVWTTSTTLTLSLPPTALIQAYSNISFYSSIYSPLLSGTLSVSIAPPDIIPVPIIVLYAPQDVQCDDILLDASNSYGNGGRSFSSISWSLYSNITSFNTDTLATYIRSGNSLYLSIPASYLPSNSTFTVSVTVNNWLGQSAIAYSTFNKRPINAPYFPIYLSYPNYQQIYSFLSINYDARTIYSFSTSNCNNITDASKISYTFQWSQILSTAWPSEFNNILLNEASASASPSNDVLNLVSLKSSTRTLSIPAYTLIVGQTYGFKLKLTVRDSTNNSLFPIQSYYAYAAIKVLEAPLIAKISGGDRNVNLIQLTDIMTLDASYSVDLNTNSGTGSSNNYNYSWVCTQTSTRIPCFNDTYTSQLASPTLSPTLNVPLIYLVNLTSISWQVTVATFTRSSISDTIVNSVSYDYLPVVSINVVVNSKLVFQKINPSDRIQLSALLSSSNFTGITYQWSLIGSNIELSSILYTAINSESIVIVPNSLNGGQAYVFSVKITSILNPLYSSQANITLIMNAPPSYGTCSIYPLTGYVLSTNFTIQCFDWTDDISDYPLSYSFIANPLIGEPIILAKRQSFSIANLFLPAPDSSNNPPPLVITALITDVWGSVSIYNFTVIVRVPVVVQSSVINLALQILSITASVADSNPSMQYISMISQSLNSSNLTTSERGNVRDQLVTYAAQVHNLTYVFSMDILYQAASMIYYSSDVPSELTVYTRALSTHTIQQIGIDGLLTTTTVFASTFSFSLLAVIDNSIIADILNNTSDISHSINIATYAQTTIDAVSRGLIFDNIVGEIAKSVISSNINVTSLKSGNSSSASLSSGYSNALLPADLYKDLSLQSFLTDFSLIAIGNNLYQYADKLDLFNLTLFSNLVSIKLFNSSSKATKVSVGQEILVQNLLTPILISLPYNQVFNSSLNYNLSCQFYNENTQLWSSQGCSYVSKSANSIQCACNHLTTFSVRGTQIFAINFISADNIIDFFNWDNIVANPTPIITVGVILFTFVVIYGVIFFANKFTMGAMCCIQWLFCGLCLNALDTRSYPTLTDQNLVVFTRETLMPLIVDRSIAELRPVFSGYTQMGFFQWIIQPTLFDTISKYALIFLFMLHPWLGVFLHNPGDQYTSIHRVTVLLTSLLSFLAVNALFYGQKTGSTFSDFAISVSTSFLVIPMQFFIRYLFLSASTEQNNIMITSSRKFSILKLQSLENVQNNERSFELPPIPNQLVFTSNPLSEINVTTPNESAEIELTSIQIAPNFFSEENVSKENSVDSTDAKYAPDKFISGLNEKPSTPINYRLIFAWIFCVIWNLGSIFLILVYGMQFDLHGPTTSARWITSSFYSTFQDVFINSPCSSVIQALILIYFCRESICSINFSTDSELDKRVLRVNEAKVIISWIIDPVVDLDKALFNSTDVFKVHFIEFRDKVCSVMDSLVSKLSIHFPYMVTSDSVSNTELDYSLWKLFYMFQNMDKYIPLLKKFGQKYSLTTTPINPTSFDSHLICTLLTNLDISVEPSIIYCWLWFAQIFYAYVDAGEVEIPDNKGEDSIASDIPTTSGSNDIVTLRMNVLKSTWQRGSFVSSLYLKRFLEAFEAECGGFESYDVEVASHLHLSKVFSSAIYVLNNLDNHVSFYQRMNQRMRFSKRHIRSNFLNYTSNLVFEYIISNVSMKMLDIPSNIAINESWSWICDLLFSIYDGDFNQDESISPKSAIIEKPDLNAYSNFSISEAAIYKPINSDINFQSKHRNDKCAILSTSSYDMDANKKDTIYRNITKVIAPYVLNNSGASIS